MNWIRPSSWIDILERGDVQVSPRLWPMNQGRPEWDYLQHEYYSHTAATDDIQIVRSRGDFLSNAGISRVSWIDEDAECLNAIHDGEIVGSIVYTLSEEGGLSHDRMWVYWLYVGDAYRQTDTMYRLVQPVFDEAKELGVPIEADFDNPRLKEVFERWNKRPELTAAVHDNLVEQVRENLSEDLLKPGYGGEHPMMGHCYVATESLFHLLGGKESGYIPVRLRLPDGIVHWWLKDKEGNVIDATHDQFSEPVPYEQGKAGGFLTKEPSKRAQELIQRVKTAEQLSLLDNEIEIKPVPDEGEPIFTWTGSLYPNLKDVGWATPIKALNAYVMGELVGTAVIGFPGEEYGTNDVTVYQMHVKPEYRKTAVFTKLLVAVREILQDYVEQGYRISEPSFSNDRLQDLWNRYEDRFKTSADNITIQQAGPDDEVYTFDGLKTWPEHQPGVGPGAVNDDYRYLNAYDNGTLIGTIVASHWFPSGPFQYTFPKGATTIEEVYVLPEYRNTDAFLKLLTAARPIIKQWIDDGAIWRSPSFDNAQLADLWEKYHNRFLSKTAVTEEPTGIDGYIIRSDNGKAALEYHVTTLPPKSMTVSLADGPFVKEHTQEEPVIIADGFQAYSGSSPTDAMSVLGYLRDKNMPVYATIVNDKLRELVKRVLQPGGRVFMPNIDPEINKTYIPLEYEDIHPKTAQFYDAQGQEIERGDTLVYLKDPNPDPESNQYGVQKVLHIDPERNVMVLKWHDGHRDEWLSNEANNFVKVGVHETEEQDPDGLSPMYTIHSDDESASLGYTIEPAKWMQGSSVVSGPFLYPVTDPDQPVIFVHGFNSDQEDPMAAASLLGTLREKKMPIFAFIANDKLRKLLDRVLQPGGTNQPYWSRPVRNELGLSFDDLSDVR